MVPYFVLRVLLHVFYCDCDCILMACAALENVNMPTTISFLMLSGLNHLL
jgi:hypothetical protein